jgi:hypothetical protein
MDTDAKGPEKLSRAEAGAMTAVTGRRLAPPAGHGLIRVAGRAIP